MNYPPALEAVIFSLERLPGIGKRTAERLALALLSWDREALADLGTRIAELKDRVTPCPQCGNFAEASQLCHICRNPHRQPEQVCVVEDAAQIPVIEKSGCFHGLYHVLGGRLAPLAGTGPEDLNFATLKQRVADGLIKELILATSSDVEGEATAAWLAEELRTHGEELHISRIASGLPVGADLSFADSATIAMAINRRRPL